MFIIVSAIQSRQHLHTPFDASRNIICKNLNIGRMGESMNRGYKVQAFDREGRDNLPSVIKNVKNYMRGLMNNGIPYPSKIVFFTLKGEGPMLAYNQLSGLEVTIIAVTFPSTYTVALKDGGTYTPEIPEKVRKFFAGVEIPIVRARLPFDEITGAEFHNKEMTLIKSALAVFGGSMSLAIQSVLQATDSGLIPAGEEVIAITSDTALLVTASTTRDFLNPKCGLIVNEIICKPRNFTISRPKPKPVEPPQISAPDMGSGIQIEGNLEKSTVEKTDN
jgi:hypothetical protein